MNSVVQIDPAGANTPINNCQPVTFRVTVENTGDENAANVEIITSMPAGFTPAGGVTISGLTIPNGDTISRDVTYTATCAAASGDFSVRVTYDDPGGAAQPEVTPPTTPFTINPGAITITKVATEVGGAPITPTSKPDAAIGQVITWEIRVRSSGLGAVSNVVVTDTLGAGLSFTDGATSPRTFDQSTHPALASIAANDVAVISLQTTVNGCGDLTNDVSAEWGCAGPPAETCLNPVTARSSVDLQIGTPLLDFNPQDITFAVPYCSATVVLEGVSLDITNAGTGTASNVSMNVGFGTLTVSNITPGGVIYSGTAFENIPDIPAGDTVTLTYDLTYTPPINWCAGGALTGGSFVWSPSYSDPCGNPFAPPLRESNYFVVDGGTPKPAVTVAKTCTIGGQPLGLITPLTDAPQNVSCDVTIDYTGPTTCGAGTVSDLDLLDDFPDEWTLNSVTPTGGTPATGLGAGPFANAVNWTIASANVSDGASFTYQMDFTIPALGNGDVCDSCGQFRANTVSVTGTDCCGCTLIGPDSTATASTTIDCPSPELGIASTRNIAGNGAEVCTDVMAFTSTYTFNGAGWDALTWTNNLQFVEDKSNSLELIGGSLAVTATPASGVPCAPAFTLADNPPPGNMTVDITGPGTCGANIGANTVLEVTYQLRPTTDSNPQCGASNTFVDFATLEVIDTTGVGFGDFCPRPGGGIVVRDAGEVTVNGSEMTVDIEWDVPTSVVGSCGLYDATITLTKNSAEPAYDVVLFLEDVNYELFSVTGTAGITPFPAQNDTPDGGGSGTAWDFGDLFNGGAGQTATINVRVRGRCLTDPELRVFVGYNDACDNGQTGSDHTIRTCDGDDLVSGVIRDPSLVITKFPEVFFADAVLGQADYEPAEWTITVFNAGAGSAFNVEVIEALGADLSFLDASWDNAAGIVEYNDNEFPDDDGPPDGTIPFNGKAFVIAELTPGERRVLTFRADITGCETTTNTVRARVRCLGATCTPEAIDTAEVVTPKTDLVVTTAFVNPGSSCDIKTVSMTARNAGKTPIREIILNEFLPQTMTYIANTSEYRINGGVWIGADGSVEPTIVTGPDLGPPTVLATENLYQWAYDDGALPAGLTAPLTLLDPGDVIEIRFNAYVSCDFEPGRIRFNAGFDECGSAGRDTTSDSVFNLIANEPVVTITKTPSEQDITCGGGANWTVEISNAAQGTAGQPIVAQYIWIQDTWGDGYDDATVTITPQAGAPALTADNFIRDDAANTLTWEIYDMPADTVYRYDIAATYDICGGDLGNRIDAEVRCLDPAASPDNNPAVKDPGCLIPPGITSDATSIQLQPQLATTLISQNLDACAEDVPVTIELRNDSADVDLFNLDIEVDLPAGVTFDVGTAEIIGDDGTTVLSTEQPVLAGNTLRFFDTDRATENLPNRDPAPVISIARDERILIRIQVDIACVSSGSFAVRSFFQDCCNLDGPLSEATLAPTWRNPVLDITVETDAPGPFDCGEQIAWNIIITNNGAAAADMATFSATLGDGLTFPAPGGVSPFTSPNFFEIDAGGTKIGPDPLFLFTTGPPRVISWEIADLPAGGTRRYRVLTTADSTDCADDASRTLSALGRWHCTSAANPADEDPSSDESTCGTDDVGDSAVANVVPDVSASANIDAASIGYCNRDKEVTATFTTGADSNTIYNLEATVTLPNDAVNGVLRFVGDGNTADTPMGNAAGLINPVTIPAGNTSHTFRIADSVDPGTTITVTFDVNSSCFITGDIAVEFRYQDCCQNGAGSADSYSATASQTVNAEAPVLEITNLSRDILNPVRGDTVTYTVEVTNTGTLALYGKVAVQLSPWMRFAGTTAPVLNDDGGAVAPESTGHGCVADPRVDENPCNPCAVGASDTYMVWDLKDFDTNDTWTTTVTVTWMPPVPAPAAVCDDDLTDFDVTTYFDCPDDPGVWDATWATDGPAACTNETGGNCDLRQDQTASDTIVGYCAAIGDRIWYDADGDGVQDAGEPNFDGVSVELFYAGGDGVIGGVDDVFINTDTTDANGIYGFADLIPAAYYLVVTKPSADYVFSALDLGGDDAFDSDVTPATGDMSVTTLAPVENDTSWDGGLFRFDFGDLPDSYGTLDASNGARHILENVTPTAFLGTSVDADTDGQDSVNADGDDGNGTDDEDGILFTTSIQPNSLVELTAEASAVGSLNAWIDFNGDGDFADPGERIFTNAALTAGSNTLSFTAPNSPNPFATTLYARFRYTPATGAPAGTPDGQAIGGEVEDYALMSLGDRVWRDNGAGGGVSNNGVLDGVEAGIAGVVLELYRDLDGDDTPEPGGDDGAAIGTTTTDANGEYRFTGLAPGDYFVRIPPSEFGGGEPLFQHLSTLDAAGTGNVDPDADADNQDADENGVDDAAPDAGGINALPVSLVPGAEPAGGADGDNDANSNRTIDFAFYVPLSLGNLVWFDADNDGAVDGGETGILGVEVRLYRSGDTPGVDMPVATDTTDAGGFYQFVDLVPGDYFVHIPTPPAGFPGSSTGFSGDDGDDNDDNGDQAAFGDPVSSPTITLLDGTEPGATGGGNAENTIDFGFFRPVNLGGTVWHDADDSGVIDGTETGINGTATPVTVALYNAGETPGVNPAVATTTIDASGNYNFTGLAPGDYFVYILMPPPEYPASSSPGVTDTNDNDEVDDDNGSQTGSGNPIQSQNITLISGDEPDAGADGDGTDGNLTVDFGLFAPLTLGNRVWLDANADGVQDGGEVGVAGATVILLDGGLNPVTDVNGNPVGDITTGADGLYSFSGLAPGDYIVRVTPPADHVLTTGGNDPDDNVDTDSNGVAGAPIQSLAVTLTSEDEPSATTNPGDTNDTLDFGFYVPLTVGNLVFNDIDNDGVFESGNGEEGIGGVLLELYRSGDVPGTNAPVATDTTDAGGLYAFTGVTPGDYFVYIPTPPGAFSINSVTFDNGDATDNNDNGNQAVAGGPVQSAVFTLRSGGEPDAGVDTDDTNGNLTIDFGFYDTLAIGNLVWRDADNNGRFDAGETGIDGVTVELYRDVDGDGIAEPGGADGAAIATETTATGGQYEFIGLSPGNYFVHIPTPPVDYPVSSTGAGGDDGVDNDDNGDQPGGANGAVTGPVIELLDGAEPGNAGLGSVENTQDFGFYNRLNLGGTLWNDADDSGAIDNGETGDIADVTVQLFRAGENPAATAPLATTTTDAAGSYNFTGLDPGDYFVYIPTPPAAFPLSSTPTDTADNDEDNDDNGQQAAINGPVRSMDVALRAGEEPGTDGDGVNGNRTVDFGLFMPLQLGDFVWRDADNDGIQDAGEPGVPGVTVRLLNAAGTVEIDTTTTDAGGRYLFVNMPPANYIVEFVLPNGYVFSPAGAGGNDATDSDAVPQTPTTGRAPVDLTAGVSNFSIDAGLAALIDIGDLVWLDGNGNGAPDPGEGISGVTVILQDGAGNPLATATTDTGGNYRFPDRPPGDYRVLVNTATLPTGITQLADPDATLDSQTTLTNQTTDNLNADFGYTPLGAIGDYVFEDRNRNGVQDAGDVGVAGVTVNLIDSTGAQIYSDVTDANGLYRFTGLVPGDYTVEFVLPADFTFTGRNVGDDDGTDSDADPTTGRASVTIGLSETNLFVDAGLLGENLITIGDLIWLDNDQNSAPDPGEGLSNVTVILQDGAGNPLDTTTTNASGNYSFPNLPAGDYRVKVDPATLPTGAVQLTDPDGTFDSQTALNNQTADNLDADFGYRLPGAIGDFVWRDDDGDGVQDPGEPGVPGIPIRLFNAAGDTVLGETLTDANGFYRFNRLDPGSFIVEFNPPSGFAFSPTRQGDDDAVDSDPLIPAGRVFVNLGVGETNLFVDAGLIPQETITIGDLVWLDDNGDGAPGPGEGEPGITVILFDGTGAELGRTTTDAGGNYRFENLPTGDYRVAVDTATLPPGVAQLADPDAALDNETTLLNQTTDNLDADFGYTIWASLGNFVWADVDGDGVQDTAEEPGVPGVTVNLFRIDGADVNLFDTTTTGADGAYLFQRLPAGEYRVEFVPASPDQSLTTRDQGTGPLQDAFDSDPDPETGLTGTITLAAGEENRFVDAGIIFAGAEPGSIGDRVWHDTDGDGVQDSDEGGVTGVMVTLRDGDGNLIDTTTTDGLGDYRFDALGAGNYTVEFTPPDGYAISPQTQGGDPALDSDANATGRTGTILLLPGQNRDDIDAGLSLIADLPAAVGDLVWLDENRNGVRDAGEAGIEGVRVQLYDATGTNPISEIFTDAGGGYRFEGLPSGDYTVRFVPPDGFAIAEADRGGDDNTDSDPNPISGDVGVNLAPGETDLSVDAGMFRDDLIDIGDLIWLDANGNGQPDPGEGIPNVTVGICACTGAIAATTTTDANGNYRFPNLLPGNYRVTVLTETLPDGAVQLADPDGTLDSLTDVPNQTEDFLDADFGYTIPAALGDFVWLDTNGNGVQDGGEPGVAGIIARLFDAGGNFVVETTTDGDGAYAFTNLAAGSYEVEFYDPFGNYTFTDPDRGTGSLRDSFDSDVNPATGRTGLITLIAGETDNTVDAGLELLSGPPASLGDRVWFDANEDGVQDADEDGIAGATVRLLDALGGVVARTVTDGTGNYRFTGLAPGDYFVEFVPPANHQFSPRNASGNNSTDSDPDAASGRTGMITLTPGLDYADADAGLFSPTPPGSIGDFVWLDANGNGVQNAGETGVPGVTVRLYDATGVNLISTATTDATGAYRFEGLPPGDYVLIFGKPAGYDFATPNSIDANGDDNLDSDADPNTGRVTTPVSVAAGQDRTDIDAGLTRAGLITIGDLVWLDDDANGLPSPGEGIPGVTVILYDGTGREITRTTTDGNGNYAFPNRPPGDFRVAVDTATLPPGSGPLADPDGVFDSATDRVNQTTDYSDADFGYTRRASVGDFVWLDLNGDGVQDAGETGVPGIRVILLDDAGTTVAETTTDGNGAYLFTGLEPGDYRLRFIDPAGNYAFTAPNRGSGGLRDAFDSDVDPMTGETASFTLSAGEVNRRMDAGLRLDAVLPASLGDRVWYDADGNGVQDPGEGGVAGIVVRLLDAAGNLIATTTTNGTGDYAFANLVPGDYSLEFVNPGGYGFSPVGQGGDGARDSDADPATGRTGTITLAAGDNFPDADAGIFLTAAQPASVGDRVWLDANRDGIYNMFGDAGESGVPGVIVRLYDATGVNLISQTVTDADGNYRFEGLPADDYLVQFIRPSGYTFTPAGAGNPNLDSNADPGSGLAPVSLIAGIDRTDIDAGLYRPDLIDIGDFVWLDADNNGLPSPNEGIPGVTLILYDGDGNVIATTTTDADGGYLFRNLPPGDFRVAVDPATLPPGSGPMADPDGVFDSSTDLVNQTTDNLDADFGYTDRASLGDFVWYDADGDGVQEIGETGIAGVTVRLLDAAGNLLAETVTAGNGAYRFTGLLPGDYRVEFVKPSQDFAFVPPDVISGGGAGGLQDAFDSDADVDTGLTGLITLAAGENNTRVDAGLRLPNVQPASIGDRVWFDADGNGVQDDGETGVAGVIVRLLDAAGNPVAETVTDGSGAYRFTGLPAGDYSLEFTPPEGFDFTASGQGGNGAIDSDPNPADGRTGVIALSAGQNYPDADAGLFSDTVQPASLGDRVWLDANRDGIQDAGESGVPGVIVRLYDATGVNLISQTVTDANGNYRFDGLIPGDYVVAFDRPAGYTFAPTGAGTNAAFDSDANPSTGRLLVTLADGMNRTDIDAGLYRPDRITIGDLVWLDGNGDGTPSPSEGIPGVTVILYDGNGNVITTTVTDGNGNYRFPDLPPGDYRVSVDTATLPGGVGNIADPDGTPDSSTDLINQTVDTLDADFGYAPGITIGDTVWLDGDGNGVPDAGEGIAGVTVILTDGNGNVIATTVTDSDGHYAFTNLPPGDYRVLVDTGTLPDGLTPIYDPDGGADSRADLPNQTSDNPDVDFGYSRASGPTPPPILEATLGNFTWDDANRNGVQDPGEPGIPGVTVRLFAADGTTLVRETVTDENGVYWFTGLPAGAYVVGFVPPAGYTFTRPDAAGDSVDSDPDAGTGRVSVTLPQGGFNPTVDAGLYRYEPITIGDLVWLDKDGDGTPDPGEGIPGVTVILTDGDGNVITTVTTDPDGGYSFPNLSPGDYQVIVDTGTLPPGVLPLTDPDGGFDSRTDLPDQDSDNPDVDFGYTLKPNPGPELGIIGDVLWFDGNRNGVQDPDEGGFAGVTVRLYDGTGTVLIARTVTDAEGRYSFANLPAGDYIVEFIVPAGYELTAPNTDNDHLDSDPLNMGGRVAVTLPGGGYDMTIDVGLVSDITVSIGDLVWLDKNNNGLPDDGEGIPGVRLNLYDGDGNLFATRVTDANGLYLFDGLLPGDYTVRVDGSTVPPEATLFAELDGTFDGDVSLPGHNTDRRDVDFGYRLPTENAPEMANMTKTAVDLNGGSLVPGDTIAYSITIFNAGDGPAENAVYTDAPDPFTTLRIGSVSTTLGIVTMGNNPGDAAIRIEIGAIGAGESLVVAYQVVLNAAPKGTMIENQGTVTGDNFPDEPTDDPSTVPDNDPTIIGPVGGDTVDAGVVAIKRSADVNGEGGAKNFSPLLKPGDTVQYDIEVKNLGPAAAENLVFTDAVPLHTTLVSGSLTTSRGTAIEGNPPRVEIGTLAAGESALISFRAVIDANAKPGTVIWNQGIVTGTGGITVPTDDPVPPGDEDPNIDILPADGPKLDLLKTVFDMNAGLLAPGDTLEYTLTVVNTGDIAVSGVVLTDSPVGYIALIPGTVGNTAGVVVQGNGDEDRGVVVNIGALQPGEQASVTFQAVISESAPDGEKIPNHATATAPGLPDIPSDDPKTPSPDDPTVVIVVDPADTNSPPGVFKTVSGQRPVIHWRVRIVNDRNVDTMLVHMEDPIPNGSVYVDGSLSAGDGIFWYDSRIRKVVWEGYIPGNGGEIVITYATVVEDEFTRIDNRACVIWDLNQNDDWRDESDSEIPWLCSDDPTTPEPGDATVWRDLCYLELGNLVWIDKNRDALCSPDDEPLLNGVRINLYRDTDGNNVYTPGVDEFLATTVTFNKDGLDGYYLFANLCEGDYIVQVDPSNFAVGGVLEGFESSPGAPDPDDDVDADDNGGPMAGHGVVSQAVSLRLESEPVSEDLDGNTNLTVDFGFFDNRPRPECPDCDVPVKPF